ncbi:MAG TPA: hypothetical protein VNK43_09515 [Gemmatimonadales bacterium]|nr:hypothetical protein [Gemmatimonadales bacterium]
MSVEARVEPYDGKPPSLNWRWDPETDILSGSFKVGARTGGLNGSIELTGEDGAIAVLDVEHGVIRGLDVVVWPEVASQPGLAPPRPTRTGRVVVAKRSPKASVDSLEVDAALAAATNADESVFHLRIGSLEPAEVIQVADHFLVELDGQSRLAGIWLTHVPPFPAGGED